MFAASPAPDAIGTRSGSSSAGTAHKDRRRSASTNIVNATGVMNEMPFVKRRKMLMISYEDEIDTKSHRKQTRRRRMRHAPAREDESRLSGSIKPEPSSRAANREENRTSNNSCKMQRRRPWTSSRRWRAVAQPVSLLVLMLTLPMVMRTGAQEAPATWPVVAASGGEPNEGAPESDSFGSRLAETSGPNQSAFMSRQGQLGDGELQVAARRQARQPAPILMQQQPPQQSRPQMAQGQSRPRQAAPPLGALPLNSFVLQHSASGSNLNQEQLQERFQRLRATPAQNFEQFPRPQGNPGPNGFGPNGNQFAPPSPQQQQQNQRLALGVPTLSAFDLSSLANLANNQPNGQPQQLPPPQQLQPTFRRITPQPPREQQPVQVAPPQPNRQQQQQQQQQLGLPPVGQFFDSQNQNERRQQQQQPNPPTELPFIRQVFRPEDQTAAPVEPARNQAAQSGGRPTPPPLFVPPRQQLGGGNQQQPQQQQQQQRRPFESGFSPIQSSRLATPSQFEAPAFFEPAGPETRPATSPLANQSQPLRQQVPPSVNDLQPGQRKPVRRPSQRPHVPTSVNGSSPNPQQQQQLLRQQVAADVIRLAANAVQAANEGLASSGAVQAPSSLANKFAATATTTTTTDATTTTAASTTASEATSPASSATTTTGDDLGRRAVSQPQPPRTSANLFQTLAGASTLLPSSSFSPALPINQAVGATGGRRRIPVRVSGGRNPQATTPLTPSSSNPSSTITTQAPASTSSPLRFQSTARENVGVRRPEIEDFYETIGSSPAGPNSISSLSDASSPTATTQIDGFGVPSRPRQQPAANAREPSESSNSVSTSTDPADRATTTDMYGSRLPAGAPQESNRQSTLAVRDQAQIAASPVKPLLPAQDFNANRPDQDQDQDQDRRPVAGINSPRAAADSKLQAVMVPVTYVTTLTYLTTVLHGTHTLETSHESVERSTRMATMNAQLINQIEHKVPLVEPTATVSLSSRVKGKGTTLVNLKSVVSAYNQELVDALNAAAGFSTAAPQIQPTQVVGQPAASAAPVAAEGSGQVGEPRRSRPLQRPSRTVELRDLKELRKRLATEYIYSFTMRPVGQPDQLLATSVRSELVVGSQLVPDSQGERLMLMAAAANQADTNGQGNSLNLIDSDGLLRVAMPNGLAGNAAAETSQINLGSTVGRDTPQTMTEVNMEVATYLKFDGISNVMLELRPTASAAFDQPERPLDPAASVGAAPSSLAGKSQLDTSFNVHLTLGNALDQLQAQPAASQQTPALESAAPTRTNGNLDLLRSSAVSPQPPASEQPNQSAISSNLARSQLRSRVASSRFRSQFQTLQPARSSELSSPAGAVAVASESVAPSASVGARRPIKSRILRPNLLKPTTSAPPSDQSASSEVASAAASSAAGSGSTRSTKARFVVVTRTGQFGIRASAISSLASASASESSIDAASPVQSVRVSSRFSKPNRFGGGSRSVQVTRVRPGGELLQTVAPALPSSRSTQLEAASSASPVVDSAPSTTGRPTSGGTGDEPASIKADAAASVIVTYFTTTTHTIPFELNSETVFTTIEETNSRIATEYMSDLTSHFIEPTPVADLPEISRTAPPAGAGLPVSTEAAATITTTTAATATTTTTSATTAAAAGETTGEQSAPTERPPGESGDRPKQDQKQLIEPSFATTLKTQTHFTTFTYFTTYSAGSGSQTVQSSESTTSNVVIQTVSSQIEPSATAANQIEATSSAVLQEQQASGAVGAQPDVAVTKTLLSTMTYYGTVYNGTSTSLTPIIDVSTRLLTLDANGNSLGASSSPAPAFTYLNSDLLAPSSTLAPSVVEPSVAPSASESGTSSSSATPPLEINPSQLQQVVDRITRTKSMYTTLTHFITFYSGTKTQLSTIQEISPTVVTEYIDRTAFEQQQADAAHSISSSAVLVSIPSSAVLSGSSPSEITTTTSTTATPTSSTESETSTSSSSNTPGGSELDQTSSEAKASTTSAASSESAPTSEETPTTTTTSTTTTTTTTQQPELSSVLVSAPSGQQNAENQQSQAQDVGGRALASSDPSAAATDSSSLEPKQATNIIELSDLIASNSSQSGRVALAGNLGAAIKDIVQLLAGNKTQQSSSPESGMAERLPVNLATLPSSSEPTTTAKSASQQQDQPSTPATSAASSGSTSPRPPPGSSQKPRLFGNKQRQSELQGSITSPAMTTSSTTVSSLGDPADVNTARNGNLQQVRPTPDLNMQLASSAKSNQAAATIFFGDDSNDERKKQIKTVWPGAQSTIFVTSVEPSTRSLTVTTTKVYYTRDAQLTITSSYVSTIAPRTFVSTIMGTRTLVSQLNGPSATVAPAAASAASETPRPPTPAPTRAADTQNAAVANRYKQQKKEQQQVAHEQRKLQQQAAAVAAAKQQQQAKAKLEQQQQLAMANINQCQPSCKASLNEICRFTPAPTSDGLSPGAQGSFACACRPGYYMQLNSVGQRQCQEVQSYVILLRLLQIGDQQISFKRELQQRSSPEFKQFARIVREHVKRAYMTSDLIRDRYVGSDILNFARTLSVSSGVASQSMGAQPSQGKQPLALNVSQLDPLNAGVVVNMTIHLQQTPAGATGNTSNDIQLDETLLKEELAKKLNMRQAAALAAAAASATSGSPPPVNQPDASSNSSASATADRPQAEQPALLSANQTADAGEPLPNPNALFLADVEQVQDLDECASPMLNDCHEGAVCVNEPGSYKCDCREYPDLNPLNPGRQCANELKSCDFCNNRGDCLRVPSLMSASSAPTASTNTGGQPGNGRGQSFSTVCQCHRIYLGRRCEINGLLLATLLPILAILMIISVCLVIYCCRRWRRRSSLGKGFRNIGSFGPNIIGSTLDRKAMLESSSESSDTHQRHQASGLHQHHLMAGHPQQHLRNGPLANSNAAGPSSLALYEASSDPSSSQESSPRQMSSSRTGELNSASSYLHHLTPPSAAVAAAAAAAGQANSLNPYSSSIPPQIVIPRARHNQVNYAVHRGQVYMW